MAAMKARTKNVCCLRFWLVFFIFTVLALIGVILWLVLAPKHAQNTSTFSSGNGNVVQGASGNQVSGLCTLPAARGPCKAIIERFFFDSTTGTCKKFIYGGCSGNDNNFETLEACTETCIPQLAGVPTALSNEFNLDGLDTLCKLQKDIGPCRGSHKRWYFDTEQGRCLQFYYGGCRGNANNFESKQSCEAKCMVAAGKVNMEGSLDTSVCNLPRERGQCLAEIMRWGFDASLGRCVQFTYGGCNGNANNFETKEACEQQCLASIPMPLSPVGLDASDKVCQMPPDAGPCRRSIRRWAYDVSKASCVEFVYGGCQGNENNFETQEACEAKCSEGRLVGASICQLPYESGNCYAFLKRWAFNPSSGKCIQFIYGGCGGNANNFETKQACEQQCIAESEGGGDVDMAVCQLPRERGKCRASFLRWGFDPSTGECVKFIYGGCGGNANNFETKNACEQQCRAAMPMPLANDNLDTIDPACKMSQDPGPCFGKIRRWSFNASGGTCVQFFYSGCQGNANNFETRDACEAKCLDPMVQPDTNSISMMEFSGNANNVPVCKLPFERGDCMAYIPRWGFDVQSAKCIQFIYGGCGGNANNFETKEECEKYCHSSMSVPLPVSNGDAIDPVCKLPTEVGPCRGSNKRWTFNIAKGICEEFIYGGCRGNANNFESKGDCETRCGGSNEKEVLNVNEDGKSIDTSVCDLPHERGNCGVDLLRWAFDSASGKCILFAYSGCGGNGNNFETRYACEQRCLANALGSMVSSGNEVLDPVCQMPQDVGPCRASIKRWFYDASKGDCAEFIYGGCRGNGNNFETKEACETKCGGFKKAVGTPNCQLPLERGNCYAYLQRWGFDPTTSRCVQFVYGGCGGNNNNFETKEDCEKICFASDPMPLSLSKNVNADQLCSLPRDTGPCRGSHRRWTFDASEGGCVEFVYGGCGGNANNFVTKKECEARCGGSASGFESKLLGFESDIAVCHQPRERGDCLANLKRWGFDPSTGSCVQFFYGGCGGNENNFESKEACELRCIAGPPLSSNIESFNTICNQPIKVGPCRGSHHRWAYDTSLNKCVEFIYGGCQGNDNNFETKEACETTCRGRLGSTLASGSESGKEVSDTPVCQLPLVRGTCMAYTPRWGFDHDSSKCVLFVYGGCGGNGNNFETKQACEEQCLANIPDTRSAGEDGSLDPNCKLPKDVGPCKDLIRRWFYDTSEGQCIEFHYGGCGGNANNFESKEDCESRCSSITHEDTSICNLPQERGNCSSVIRRWSFDASAGKCIQFVYGGCGGNTNNFETKEDCEQRCLANIPAVKFSDDNDALDPICKLPKDVGPCRASLPRWTFNGSSGKCVEFIYGGCRGNENNFMSKEACETKCGAAVPSATPPDKNSALDPTCKLPQVVGPCRAMLKRWSYDVSRSLCVEFYYGGCRGNANNFDSKEACEAKCSITGVEPKVETDICKLPRRPGPCRGKNHRFYYDNAAGQCLEFIYGGCRGNANNFMTKEECEAQCPNTA